MLRCAPKTIPRNHWKVCKYLIKITDLFTYCVSISIGWGKSYFLYILGPKLDGEQVLRWEISPISSPPPQRRPCSHNVSQFWYFRSRKDIAILFFQDPHCIRLLIDYSSSKHWSRHLRSMFTFICQTKTNKWNFSL